MRGDDLDEVIARASSPEERLSGGWVTAAPDVSGRERADRWHARVGRGDDRRSAAVLASRGLGRDDLVRSLSAGRLLDGGERPPWATTVATLHSRCAAGAPDFPWGVPTLADIAGDGLPPGVDGRTPWRFLGGFRAWLGAAASDLRTWVVDSGAPVADDACRDLVLDLSRRLLAVVGPTLVTAAGAGPVFDDDVAERWLALWGAQPVTARLMAVAWLQWSSATRSLVSASAADLPALAPGRTVVGVDCGAGDRHGDGRTVVALRLDDGTRLFHKPRAVGPARTLAAWLGAVDSAGEPLGLRLPVVHARAGYAWVEEVPAGECADRAAVSAYYRRAGALLRILQVLGATDLHHENFVPTDDQPVLVDLETAVAHGAWSGAGGGTGADSCDRDLAAVLSAGVAATSMVTSIVDGQPAMRSVDLGALAGPDSRPTPYPVLAPTPAGSGLAMSPQRPAMPNGQALPVLHGVPVAVAAFAADVTAGYRDADERLRRIATAGMPVVADDEVVRFVARPTRVYVRLLQDSLTPAALADGAERELVLERLWLAADSCPPPVIAAEQAALRRLDVPVFWAPLRDRDLVADDGTRVPDALDAAAVTSIRRRWERTVTTASTDEAVEDLRAALFAAADTTAPPPAPHPAAGGAADDPADLDDALEVLLAQAHGCGEGSVAWLGLELDPGRQRWRPGRLGPGLLGEAGIGLALAARSALAPAAPPRCPALARATLLTAAARARRLDPGRFSDGFSGPAGTLYAVARAAALLDDPTLAAAATALLPAVLSAAATDPPSALLDPVSGAACACWHLPASAARDDALARLSDLLAASADDRDPGRADPLTSPWSQALPGRAAGRALARRRLGLPVAAPAWLRASQPVTAGDRVAAAALGRPVPGPPDGAPDASPDESADRARTAHEWLDLAEEARAGGPAPQAQDLQALAARWIGAGRRRAGTWFPGVLAPDSRNLSAVHGMAAVVLLGVGHHPDAPTVRILA